MQPSKPPLPARPAEVFRRGSLEFKSLASQTGGDRRDIVALSRMQGATLDRLQPSRKSAAPSPADLDIRIVKFERSGAKARQPRKSAPQRS